jgi:hypothetical protein
MCGILPGRRYHHNERKRLASYDRLGVNWNGETPVKKKRNRTSKEKK